MPALGHVVVLHTSKISPYTARGRYVCSCKDLGETELSRCEIQIGLCAAIVVLELADLHGTPKVFHIRYKPKCVRDYYMSLLVECSFAASAAHALLHTQTHVKSLKAGLQSYNYRNFPVKYEYQYEPGLSSIT